VERVVVCKCQEKSLKSPVSSAGSMLRRLRKKKERRGLHQEITTPRQKRDRNVGFEIFQLKKAQDKGGGFFCHRLLLHGKMLVLKESSEKGRTEILYVRKNSEEKLKRSENRAGAE